MVDTEVYVGTIFGMALGIFVALLVIYDELTRVTPQTVTCNIRNDIAGRLQFVPDPLSITSPAGNNIVTFHPDCVAQNAGIVTATC